MPCNSTKQFWVGDITQLFCDFNILPQSDNLVDNMNALTRLVIVISLVVLYVNVKVAILILLVGLGLITVFYYSLEKVEAPRKEDYQGPRGESYQGPRGESYQGPRGESYQGPRKEDYQGPRGESYQGPRKEDYQGPRGESYQGRALRQPYCNDATPITPNDPSYISKNQILVQGGSRLPQANPKTYVKPLVAAPSHDLSVWKANDFVHHSGTNNKSTFDFARAGYSLDSYGPLTTTHFSPDKAKVLTSTGAGDDEGYEDRLRTQMIQPGVYQKNLGCEPTNSLIGISAPPQLHPNRVEKLPNGGLKLTELPYIGKVDMKPSLGTPINKLGLVPEGTPEGPPGPSQLQPPFDVNQSPFNNPPATFPDLQQSYDNVYDPRLTGYGDQSRYYIDPMTGSPSWYYKDVESVTKPNYIVRSKIDTMPFADTYGPDKPNPYADSANFREMANHHFHDSQIAHRTDLQTRLMRKGNSILAQRRAAPISSQPRFMAGSRAYV